MVHGIYFYIGNHLPGFWHRLLLVRLCYYNLACFQKCLLANKSSTFLALQSVSALFNWSGSSSKEQIVIIFGIVIIGFVTKCLF